MLPLLILQIFLFPLTASSLMNVWVESRRTLALQEAASHLGSTIQQVYFVLNHQTIPAGTTTTSSPGLPKFIDGYWYTANATLRPVGSTQSSAQVLDITLKLVTTTTIATTSVILGSNAQWSQTPIFVSNSTSARVCGNKVGSSSQPIIQLSFGG
jgi:hypothetical protein